MNRGLFRAKWPEMTRHLVFHRYAIQVKSQNDMFHHAGCQHCLCCITSFAEYVSFAEYRLFYRSLLQKRPIILSILLTVATPYSDKGNFDFLLQKEIFCRKSPATTKHSMWWNICDLWHPMWWKTGNAVHAMWWDIGNCVSHRFLVRVKVGSLLNSPYDTTRL